MTKRVRQAKAKTTADYAMPIDRLDPWLRARVELFPKRPPVALSLSMLDGFVSAIVVGPVSLAPPDWICPLLGVEPDAFNHDDEEFSAIAATAMRHNAISEILSTEPTRFEPIFVRDMHGNVDPRPWCEGFHAAMTLRLLAWDRLLRVDTRDHRMLAPILSYCSHHASEASTRETWKAIPAAVEAMRQFWQNIRYQKYQ